MFAAYVQAASWKFTLAVYRWYALTHAGVALLSANS